MLAKKSQKPTPREQPGTAERVFRWRVQDGKVDYIDSHYDGTVRLEGTHLPAQFGAMAPFCPVGPSSNDQKFEIGYVHFESPQFRGAGIWGLAFAEGQ